LLKESLISRSTADTVAENHLLPQPQLVQVRVKHFPSEEEKQEDLTATLEEMQPLLLTHAWASTPACLSPLAFLWNSSASLSERRGPATRVYSEGCSGIGQNRQVHSRLGLVQAAPRYFLATLGDFAGLIATIGKPGVGQLDLQRRDLRRDHRETF
jgi:hypothetical protein